MGSYTATPASTATLTTVIGPDGGVNEAGIESVGSWNSNSPSVNAVAELENIPAPIIPSLPSGSNPEVIQVSPNSYKAILSLSEVQTLQLTPSFNNAQSAPVVAVSPNVFEFVYTSRNVKVATISSTGLITPVGRGEVEILIGSARAANLPFAGAAAPAGQTGCEVYSSINVTVVA
jgi:hypothetical protein